MDPLGMQRLPEVTGKVTLSMQLVDLDNGSTQINMCGVRETGGTKQELKGWEVQGLLLRALSMFIINEGAQTEKVSPILLPTPEMAHALKN